MAIVSVGKAQKKANNFKTNDDNNLKFCTHSDIYLNINYDKFYILTMFSSKATHESAIFPKSTKKLVCKNVDALIFYFKVIPQVLID